MGGIDALRGFLYQGFASVLEALTDKSSWDKIYIEYPTSNDKVDIALEEKNHIIKCIQVKSSVNLFKRKEIINWITELINDKESPEYELFLIGQCDNSANIFIKSIKKYYDKALDFEAEKSLKDFDIPLDDKLIKFTILPFKIEVLEKIVRDSLHQYISNKGYMMTFEQISSIVPKTFYDNMVSSTDIKGMDREEFDKELEKLILLLANNYSTKRESVFIKSYSVDANYLAKEGEKCLSLVDKFDKRKLKDKYSWKEDIYDSLKEFLINNTNTETAYKLYLDTHTSIAFSAGRILNSKSGINIFPLQKTADRGIVLWDVKFKRETEYSNWKFTYEQLQENQFDVALILNVSRNIEGDVIRFIEDENLPIGRIISCITSEAGATNISIKNGTHAVLLANDIYSAIATRSLEERRATLHIFASAPNAFMFFLGQNSHGFGKCTLYEYDFEQKESCTYSQSISF